MKHDLKTYGIFSGVFVLSLTGAYFIDATELMKAVLASPGVVSLIAALYQLMRDQAAYEKQLSIQDREFQFSIGAASHMANTAFDKHVEFCESYMYGIHEIAHLLFREAETPGVLKNANKLYAIREKYAVWLTDDINENLEKFESAIRTLGAHAHFIKKTAGEPSYAEQRSIKIDENHELFSEILGIDKQDDVNEEYAVDAIKGKVRKILGTEQLTELREHLLNKASKLAGNN
jgi:hypothetical protein